MANPIKTRIQHKADTLANWKKASGFIPLENELLLVTDTGAFLRGDGSTSAAALANGNRFFGYQPVVESVELISADDIDAICGTVIQDASDATSEVTF